MTTQELQQLKEAGFSIDQIAEIDTKLDKRVGFRELVRMAKIAQDYDTPEIDWQEAWRLATVMRSAS